MSHTSIKSNIPSDKPTKPRIIWLNVSMFTITTAVAVIGAPIYAWFYDYSAAHWVALILCLGYCGMSITAGYHRLWSHKAYQTNTFIRIIYALGGAFAVQNSALHWSSDHRVHHRFVDSNDKDPYSAKMGFWYSHIGWMLREYQAHRYSDYSNVKDLQRDPIVMWQHKHYLLLVLLTNLGIPTILGLIFGDVLGMLLMVGFVRLVLSHHSTFFINSLAHLWGTQPYTDENTAKDNPILAFFTFGEGYHNYHHYFQNDYRNGLNWWQFDPTKWWIVLLSWLGLAKGLKSTDKIKIEQAKANMVLKSTSVKLIQKGASAEKLEKLKAEFDLYMTELNQLVTLKRDWLLAKKDELVAQVEIDKYKALYHSAEQEVKALKESWVALNKSMIRLQPNSA